MTVTITLVIPVGGAAGPFDLYSDTDGYANPFATNIDASTLVAGYTSTAVPNGTTIIKVRSLDRCKNSIDIPVSIIPTTTTTTTTSCRPQGLITVEYFNSYDDGSGVVDYTATEKSACSACEYINSLPVGPSETSLFGQSATFAIGQTVYAGTGTSCDLLADGFYITDHATCQITEIVGGIIINITYCTPTTTTTTTTVLDCTFTGTAQEQ